LVCEICDEVELIGADNILAIEGSDIVAVCSLCRRDLKENRLVLCKSQFCKNCKQRLWNREYIIGGDCGNCINKQYQHDITYY
jgi:hypothetical protein